jgi:hypothetical protein
MPDWHFDVNNAGELDGKLREILFLENVGRGDEIYGLFMFPTPMRTQSGRA